MKTSRKLLCVFLCSSLVGCSMRSTQKGSAPAGRSADVACRELGPGYETSFSQTTFSLRGVDRTKVKVSWLAGTLRLKHGGTSIEIMDVTSDAGAIRMHGKPGDFPLRFVLGDGRVIVWGEGYFTVDGERYETPLERGYTYAADGLLISP